MVAPGRVFPKLITEQAERRRLDLELRLISGFGLNRPRPTRPGLSDDASGSGLAATGAQAAALAAACDLVPPLAAPASTLRRWRWSEGSISKRDA